MLRAVPDDADAAVAKLRAEADAQRRRIGQLEAEVRSVRAALEEAMARAEDGEKRAADLEARLAGTADELDRARAEAEATGAELEKVLATRTMRWSKQARAVYGRLRGLRPRQGDG